MNMTNIEQRTELRWIISRLEAARAAAIRVNDNEQLLEFIDAAISTASMQLAPLLIRSEGKEPLNAQEEAIYNNLQSFLRFRDEEWANITEEQRFSAARLIVHQGGVAKIQHPVSGGAGRDMIGINFGHIFIGIEPDGYAHS